MRSLTTLRSVLRDGQLRRVELGLVVFGATETGTWLAITVFAYDRGGAGEAGVVAFLQLCAAAVAAPLIAVVADRLPRRRVLAVGFGLQAICFGLVGVSMSAGLAAIVVYPLAALAAISVTSTRPAAGAVVPSLIAGPADLTAANVASSFAMGVGTFLGPAGVGLLLVFWGPGSAFSAAAVLMAVVCGATIRLRLRPEAEMVDPIDPSTNLGKDLADGAKLLRNDASTRLLIWFLTLNFVVLGALDLAFVIVAIELLGRTEATAGLLASFAGVGTVAGAVGSIALVERRRLTWPLAYGVIAAGLAVASVAIVGGLAPAAILFAVSSGGIAVADTSGRTMLQGLTPDDTLARVFGVLEGLSMAGLALGGIGFSGLVLAFGSGPALVVIGLALPLLVIVRLGKLLAIDKARPETDKAFLTLVRGIPIFAPLPPYTVEQLLLNFSEEVHRSGVEIIRRGEAGDRFYLITEGSVEVQLTRPENEKLEIGPRWLEQGRGEFFGEIALLRNIPRTATVRSGANGVVVQCLTRDVFLEAVTGHPRSIARANATVENRLK